MTSLPSRGLLWLLVVVALWAPVRGAAQAPDAAVRSHPAIVPLAPDHWTAAVLRRAEALGLLADPVPAQLGFSVAGVGAALLEAARRAAEHDPATERLTRGWYDRFRDEFPAAATEAQASWAGAVLHSGALEAGYGERSGVIAPGAGVKQNRQPRGDPLEVPDEAGATARLTLAAAPLPWLSAIAAPAYDAGRAHLPRWGVQARVGGVAVAGGRLAVDYGIADGGSMVLSGTTPLDGLQLQTAAPVRLPGWFGHLGPLGAHGFVSRVRQSRVEYAPFLTGMQISLQPHPRLALRANRVAMIGADSANVPLSARDLGFILLGETRRGSNHMDDQVASLQFRYRVPTERLLPVTLYGDWGWNDFTLVAAARDVPGFTVGLFLPRLPALPAAGAGVEYAFMERACCRYPVWYRHWALPGGWASDTGPLAHSLGGHGSELRAYGNAEWFAARLRLDARVFVRDRGAENLYAPNRLGRSTGVSGTVSWRLGDRADVRVVGYRERGREWSESHLEAGMALFF